MKSRKSKKSKTKLLIVDDSEFIRSLVIKILKRDEELEIVGQCEDGDQVCPFLSKNEVDVILMDIEMERMNGDAATQEVVKHYPKTKVVAFSAHQSEGYRVRMIQCGVKGFVYKSTDLKTVANIIKYVHGTKSIEFPLSMERMN